MKHDMLKKNLRWCFVVCGICFLLIFLSITPSLGSSSKENYSVSPLINGSKRTSEGDIPTWYQGDEWIYTIDPLYYSGPNGSFSGTIQNFKQKVVGISDGMYEIDITGHISGDLSTSIFSGECAGEITGTSHVRVSDLAEGTTELHSEGTITPLFPPIPLPYELNLITSSSPLLELYDFPFNIGEQWQIVCMNTVSGAFTIQGLYDQSLNGSQFIDETIQCTQKQQINVPAGTYECYKIVRSDTMVWYSTDVGNMVKSTVDQSNENTTLNVVISLQSFSHTAQPITISEDISPAVTIPGTSVLISGQAIATESGEPIQNGVISIEIPSTGDSWSTTTDSGGYYSKTIVAPTMIDDTPSGNETGSGGVIVQCISGSLSGYRVQTLTTFQNTPPNTPSVQGQTDGKVGVSYSYTFVAEDPESDDVFYYVDWGDATNSSWVGPYPSDENVTLSHTFTEKGTYTIKVKARDVHYAESDWGTLQVSMPTLLTSPILMKFLQWFPIIFNLLHHLFNQ
jgi:hypothetical protein